MWGITFLVVDVPGAYNAIVGRHFIHDIQGIVSTYQLTMLYVSNIRLIAKLRGNQEMAKSCYLTALKQPARRIMVEDLNPPTPKQRRAQRKALARESEPEKWEVEMMEISMEDLDSRLDDMPIPKPDGETKQEMLVEDPTRTVAIGTDMDPKIRVNLVTSFKKKLMSLRSWQMRYRE